MKLNKQTFEFEFVDTLTCFCKGGGDNDKDDNDSGPSTNPGSRERGRGAEPPAATGPSRPDYNPDNNTNRPSDNQSSGNQGSGNQPTPITAAPTYPDGQNFGLSTTPSIAELEATLDAQLRPSVANFAELQSPNTFTATGSAMPPERVTDMAGTTFNTVTGEIVDDIGMNANTGLLGATGMEDEYDPFTGTGQTAMDVLNYNLDDQSGPSGRIRPFGGLTREQQANLELRKDFVAQQILANQTQQPSGIPTTNLTGIYTYGNDPDGIVRGYSDFGPELPFLGQTQVYSGFGADPFTALNGTENDSGADLVSPQINPMTGQSQCPDGYIFDDDLQACRMKTRSESAGDTNTGTPSSDMYYRRTSLDTAPANTPAGFDFDAANRRFTQSYAYRPSFYNKPMDLTGFTKLL